MALAAAQIEGEQLGAFRQQHIEGGAVAFGQVHHVDVIAHAAAIGGGPVAAVHLQLLPPPHGHLAHERKEVVGDAGGVFADAATGVGAHGVEVAQPGDAPAGLTRCHIGQQLLHGRLAVAVGVDRGDGRRFWDRHRFRVAVEGGAAAEHQGVAAVDLHGAHQLARAREVHIPVAQGFGQRFAHGLEAREVDHGIGGLAPLC